VADGPRELREFLPATFEASLVVFDLTRADGGHIDRVLVRAHAHAVLAAEMHDVFEVGDEVVDRERMAATVSAEGSRSGSA